VLRLRRPTVCAALLLAVAPAVIGAQNDSLRIERLVALGRVYGVVKYFHPVFLERDVGWDASVVTAVNRVNAASNTAAYADAITDLLATLGDPATRVRRKSAPSPMLSSTSAPSRKWAVAEGDSALVITIPDPNEYVAVGQLLNGATADIRHASSVVFDLRGRESDELGTLGFVFASGVNQLLPTVSVVTPAETRRAHSGFPPQLGGSSGGYWSGSIEQQGELIQITAPNRVRRIVFVVNPWSDIPPVAFALRANGQGAIVVEGTTAELAAGGSTYTIDLGEGLDAVVRIGQLTGGATADTVVPRDASGDAAMRTALAWTKRPVSPSTIESGRATYVPAAENPYAAMHYPSMAYRVLAAYRWWNTIHYFYPYRDLIGESWSANLPRSIRLLQAARDSVEYGLAVAEMVTYIHDSHGGVARNGALREYLGRSGPAVQIQYVERQPVVIDVANDSATKASGIEVGDVILSVDGEAVAARRARIAKFVAYSTPQALDAALATRLLNGAEGSQARLLVRDRREQTREIVIPRRASFASMLQYPRGGPILRMLRDNVGYADLSRLTPAMVDSMFDMFKNAKAIILDDRGYPQGTAWSIAPRLTDKKKVLAARFQRPLLTSPDTSEHTTYAFVQYLPETSKWRYHGRTVVLVDERTISQAEHTVLFLEAANKTTVVGSPTMGANGDVTNVALPGGMYAFFTGHDVRHSDGRQLQRVGIQPDVVVRPTIAGIRARRDEVLEKALEILKR